MVTATSFSSSVSSIGRSGSVGSFGIDDPVLVWRQIDAPGIFLFGTTAVYSSGGMSQTFSIYVSGKGMLTLMGSGSKPVNSLLSCLMNFSQPLTKAAQFC